jgi:uncharacterized protein YraI
MQMTRNWIALAILLLLTATSYAHAQDGSGVMAEAFRVVNIRSGPSTADAVVGQLSPGDVVQVLARSSAESDWLLVQSEGVTGWVAYFVVSVMGDASVLPILTESQQELQDAVAGAAPAINASPLSLATIQNVTATTFRRANVRTLPDIESPVLIVLQRGEILVVTGRSNAENDWLQVDTDSGSGWIAYFLVAVDGDLSQLPILSLANIASATATVESVSVVMRYNANLRTAPSLTSTVIRTVPFNTEVVADARSADGDWIRVSFDGDQGWILAALISSDTAINQLAPVE